jgi:hypothetical protein
MILDGLDNILRIVKEKINENKEIKEKEKLEFEEASRKIENENKAAYMEMFEFTQRTFLNQIIRLKMNIQMPRLICIDFIANTESEADNNTSESSLSKVSSLNKVRRTSVDKAQVKINKYKTCLRPMCEYDEGWHVVNTYVPFNSLPSEAYLYLFKIMNIVKNGSYSNQLPVFLTKEGDNLMKEIAEKCDQVKAIEMQTSFSKIAEFIERNEILSSKTVDISNNNKNNTISNSKDFGIKQCELKNGKRLWLCNEHIEFTEARLINEEKTTKDDNVNDEIKMLDFIDTIDIQLIDNNIKSSSN